MAIDTSWSIADMFKANRNKYTSGTSTDGTGQTAADMRDGTSGTVTSSVNRVIIGGRVRRQSPELNHHKKDGYL